MDPLIKNHNNIIDNAKNFSQLAAKCAATYQKVVSNFPTKRRGAMTEKPTVKIEIDAVSKGEWKALGGGNRDQWNERLSKSRHIGPPDQSKNTEAVSRAGSAAAAGVLDMNPADPIEGMLMSHLVVVNEAALNMYRQAWLNNAEYFEASTRYLQLADKATRTLVMLTERLDQHRAGPAADRRQARHFTPIRRWLQARCHPQACG